MIQERIKKTPKDMLHKWALSKTSPSATSFGARPLRWGGLRFERLDSDPPRNRQGEESEQSLESKLVIDF